MTADANLSLELAEARRRLAELELAEDERRRAEKVQASGDAEIRRQKQYFESLVEVSPMAIV